MSNVLKERERKVLDALVDALDVKSVAGLLGMSERTVYNILYRLRKKQYKARKLINVLLGYRRKSALLDKVLSRRVTIEEEEW